MSGRFVALPLAAVLSASGAAAKPLVVILADRAGTEVTDIFVPHELKEKWLPGPDI